MFILSLLLYLTVPVHCHECKQASMSTWKFILDGTKRIERISVSGVISAYLIDFSLGDDHFQSLVQSNGQPVLLYSSPSHQPTWTYTDIIADGVRLRRVHEGQNEHPPLIQLTLCTYVSRPLSLDDSPFTIHSQKAQLVSMYENDLRMVFRTFRSCLLFYSSATQGDLLIVQLIHGTIHVLFDFGSLSPTRISGGRALDDGMWHDMRWLHQFDSVQLFIDGILTNQTSPSGLYRKLDLNSQIYIGGVPRDDLSLPSHLHLEMPLRGCLYRVQLNSVNLLDFAPPETPTRCIIGRPTSLTLERQSTATIPFSFLPFLFEFRIVRKVSSFMSLQNAEGVTLVDISVDSNVFLLLSLNKSKHKQESNPSLEVADGSWHSFSLNIRTSRLEIDVDGRTVLWLEGLEVRSISVNLASILLSAEGCYRSASIDLHQVSTKGAVRRGECIMEDRCTPNPCLNGGRCVQLSLFNEECLCEKGYKGDLCQHTDNVRSCEEYFFIKSHSGRKAYTKERKTRVDLDGGGPLNAFQVTCIRKKNDMGQNIIVTKVEHDMKDGMKVSGEKKPGEVKRDLNYGIGEVEMERLVDSFETCSQFMRFMCKGGARLMTFNDERTPSSWYTTRSDKHGLQWASAPPYSRMCQCAVHSNCTHNKLCNCDSGIDGVDEGINRYSQLLPVTSLSLGGTTSRSSVDVTIGPLECENILPFETITFVDRSARLIGSKSFIGGLFSLFLHLKFTHRSMSIFAWESSDSLNWFHLQVTEGILIGEIVLGGHSIQISSTNTLNDAQWHTVMWEAHAKKISLSVDDDTSFLTPDSNSSFILPQTYIWTLGSRSASNSIGYAGLIRNFYLCGEAISLVTTVRETAPQGILEGEKGKCISHRCLNDGRCNDHFDSYSCDCSLTPFGGDDCSQDYGLWVPLNSSLSIPWQNPAHTALCHRIAVQTTVSSIPLIRGKGLFSDGAFNMSINTQGFLSISFFDGLFFKKTDTFTNINVTDDTFHDISFCATDSHFKLTVDKSTAFHFSGNFTFFRSFNVWNIVNEEFIGCISRLQIGASFPLKDPSRSRLKTTPLVQFGHCPSMIHQLPSSSTHPPSNPISIAIQSVSSATFISFATIGSLLFAFLLLLSLCSIVCYMRSRPEGVYKTNEAGERQTSTKCSVSHSQDNIPLTEREYFC